MREFMIQFNDVLGVKLFSCCAEKYDFNIQLVASDKHIVNGKSIMGIFTLDVTKPIKLVVNSDNCDNFINDIKRYIV